MTGWVATLLLPTALWAVGHGLAARNAPLPAFWAFPVVGFLTPSGLLRWCARPFAEQLVAWVLSVVGWAGIFLVHDVQVFIAFGLLAGAWGFALGLKQLRAPALEPTRVAAAAPTQPSRKTGGDGAEASGFALELRCPACGAQLAVPVYHRMARCAFCGSEHVVAGRGDTLTVVIPDAAAGEDGVKAAVLKHLRHLHYLKLYDQRVRPLVADSGFAPEAPPHELESLLPSPTSPLVNAMDREVDRAAEAYAERIAPSLRLVSRRRFLAPYWHRCGTLYQAAFGRDAKGLKRMEFAVTTIEGSVRATTAPLPAMGKLSYLRALRPLLGAPEAEVPALAVECGPEEIDRRVQQLTRRSTELAVAPLAIHATFVPEVVALVYRPWHVAEMELDGDRFIVLVDGGAGAVEGEPPVLDLASAAHADLTDEPPTLTPSRCPECGGDLAFAPDSVAHLCRNCSRIVAMRGVRWTTLPYLREEPARDHWMVPFWRFPLRLRMANGQLIVDLPHLTDGVDDTYDQIGERPQVPEAFFVSAFRTRVNKAGVRLYRRLWPLVQGRQRVLQRERFDAVRPPERVVDITLPAPEARVFARVYLALAFTQRDLARAQIKSVRERFLSTELEGEPELVFLNLPAETVEPFEGIFGRARPAAIEDLQGEPRV
jgi:ribosomal protein S14/DNA-directed RNA polymerase subunit RPC12/RpoP